jgi:hypothetical protein
MSVNSIHQIDLDYLLNKSKYDKYVLQQESGNSIIKEEESLSNNDEQYNPRIYYLTKDLLKKQFPDDLLPEVKNIFERYVAACILYFEKIDNPTSLLDNTNVGEVQEVNIKEKTQEELELEDEEEKEEEEDEEKELEEEEEGLEEKERLEGIRRVYQFNPSLDTFMKFENFK